MSILNTAVLTVTPDGEFIWHQNADEMIKTGDFSGSPAMPHILRRLRERDELLKALNAMLTHMGMDEDEWNKPTFDQARAAINKAEGKARAAINKAEEKA